MNSKSFFITGTDTGTGKTVASCALLQAAAARGLKTAAMKPVASGCQRTAGGLKNDDALLLNQYIKENGFTPNQNNIEQLMKDTGKTVYDYPRVDAFAAAHDPFRDIPLPTTLPRATIDQPYGVP